MSKLTDEEMGKISSAAKDKISKAVIELLDGHDKSNETVAVVLDGLIHTAGHLAHSLKTTLPTFMAVAAQNYQDSQACIAKIMMEDIMTRLISTSPPEDPAEADPDYKKFLH